MTAIVSDNGVVYDVLGVHRTVSGFITGQARGRITGLIVDFLVVSLPFLKRPLRVEIRDGDHVWNGLAPLRLARMAAQL